MKTALHKAHLMSYDYILKLLLDGNIHSNQYPCSLETIHCNHLLILILFLHFLGNSVN